MSTSRPSTRPQATKVLGLAGSHLAATALNDLSSYVVAAQLSSSGPGQCTCIQADLRSEAACVAVADYLKANHVPSLDILINNAAKRSADDSLWSPAPQQPVWDSVLGVSLSAAYFLTRAVLPLLIASRHQCARVINVTSVSGLAVPPYDANAYIAAKAALNHLTRALAFQLAPHNILVNAIAPGVVKSRENQAVVVPGGHVPIGRLGDADDVAGITLFLCSRASGYVTGQVIALDGGLLVKSSL